jgi:hypothetical protein
VVLGGGLAAPHGASRRGTRKDEVADPLRVSDRVLQGDRAALGHPEQREPLETERIDDGLQIAGTCLDRVIADLPVGQA